MFKDLVKLHLWLGTSVAGAGGGGGVRASGPGHQNNMKTSLSAALFSLPETTNSAKGGRREKKRGEEGRSETPPTTTTTSQPPPGAPFTSCADEEIGGKGTTPLSSFQDSSPRFFFSCPLIYAPNHPPTSLG